MGRRYLAATAIFVLAVIAVVPARADPGDDPRGLITAFQAELLNVMRDARTLGVAGRYARLDPLLAETFHMELMTRIASGAHWKDASAEQRERLTRAFRRMSASTVATLFNGYEGETFELDEVAEGPQKTTLVHTRLVPPLGTPVDISYVTKHIQERWWAIDVVVDKGISELNVRRSEYRATLAQGGVEALIKLLDAKADELVPASR